MKNDDDQYVVGGSTIVQSFVQSGPISSFNTLFCSKLRHICHVEIVLILHEGGRTAGTSTTATVSSQRNALPFSLKITGTISATRSAIASLFTPSPLAFLYLRGGIVDHDTDAGCNCLTTIIIVTVALVGATIFLQLLMEIIWVGAAILIATPLATNTTSAAILTVTTNTASAAAFFLNILCAQTART